MSWTRAVDLIRQATNSSFALGMSGFGARVRRCWGSAQ